MGFYSQAFSVFLMEESEKRRQKKAGKLMARSHSQPVNLPGARAPQRRKGFGGHQGCKVIILCSCMYVCVNM